MVRGHRQRGDDPGHRQGPGLTGSGLNQVVNTWRSGVTIPAISDGTSNTFLVGEKHVPAGRWAG